MEQPILTAGVRQTKLPLLMQDKPSGRTADVAWPFGLGLDFETLSLESKPGNT